MPQVKRSFVPFDAWSMPVEVSVSQVVRAGISAWSCGQCPLDKAGQVLAINDLNRQSEIVCEYIESLITRAEFSANSIAKMHIYYVHESDVQRDAMMSILRNRFGDTPLLVPIKTPFFYYDGMKLEIDVFFSENMRLMQSSEKLTAGLSIEAIEDSAQAHVLIKIDQEGCICADLESKIQQALQCLGLSYSNLISDHWFVTSERVAEQLQALSKANLITNIDAVVIVSNEEKPSIMGSMTFSKFSETTLRSDTHDQSTVFSRTDGTTTWISATDNNKNQDLIQQTRNNMKLIEQILHNRNLTFDNLVKLTAHYTGDSSPEELHGNLKVRHAYYSKPGPASTGLPVSALRGESVRISIDAVVVI